MTSKLLLSRLFITAICSSYFSLTTMAQAGIPSSPFTDTTKNKDVSIREDKDIVFEKAEEPASVDFTLWRKHLEANLPIYLEEAANSKMKAGQYTVMVRFIVERDGSISNVMALNDVGYGLTLGAIKVIRTGPRWKPAMQNKRKVRSYHTQPITFTIEEDVKDKKKGDS